MIVDVVTAEVQTSEGCIGSEETGKMASPISRQLVTVFCWLRRRGGREVSGEQEKRGRKGNRTNKLLASPVKPSWNISGG